MLDMIILLAKICGAVVVGFSRVTRSSISLIRSRRSGCVITVRSRMKRWRIRISNG